MRRTGLSFLFCGRFLGGAAGGRERLLRERFVTGQALARAVGRRSLSSTLLPPSKSGARYTLMAGLAIVFNIDCFPLEKVSLLQAYSSHADP